MICPPCEPEALADAWETPPAEPVPVEVAMAIALAVRREDAGRGVKKRGLEMGSLVVEG